MHSFFRAQQRQRKTVPEVSGAPPDRWLGNNRTEAATAASAASAGTPIELPYSSDFPFAGSLRLTRQELPLPAAVDAVEMDPAADEAASAPLVAAAPPPVPVVPKLEQRREAGRKST